MSVNMSVEAKVAVLEANGYSREAAYIIIRRMHGGR